MRIKENKDLIIYITIILLAFIIGNSIRAYFIQRLHPSISFIKAFFISWVW